METRQEELVRNKYRLITCLLDLPFCKIYQTAHLLDNSRSYLIDFEKTAALSNLEQEFELWLSAKEFPFPEILETWEENQAVSVVISEYHAAPLVDLVKMSSGPLPEEKIFSFFPDLKNMFKGFVSLQIALPDLSALINRVFYSAEGKIRVVPVILFHLLDRKAPLPVPFSRAKEPTEATLYLKAFAGVVCYLLTQSFPKSETLSDSARRLLRDDTAKLLSSALSGKMQSFEELEKSFQLLREERAKVPAPVPLPEPEKIIPVKKKSRMLSLAAGITKEVLKTSGQAVILILQVVIFLLFLVGSYYWEQAQKLAKAARRTFKKARQLRWNDVRMFFRSELTRAKLDILKARLSILELFPVGEMELLQFTRHLAVMLHAGVSFTYSLRILHRQATNVKLKNALAVIYGEVVGKGRPLSTAMSKTKGIFSELYINMVSAGEITGSMDSVLHQIADYLEKTLLLKQKVKRASTYPIIISIACFGLFSFFVYVILPRLIEIFQGLNIEYPWPTRVLMAIVRFAHSPLTILLTVIGAVVIFFPLLSFFQSLIGKARVDELKLGLPVFGKLYKKVLLTRFCSTLGTMVRCGVPLLNALEVTGNASGNEFFNKIVAEIIERARIGMALNAVIAQLVFFPPLVLSMVQVGEESGNLEGMLVKLSEIYDAEVTHLLQQFISLIEPILMATMGLVVGFVVIAIFMPIYAIINGVHP